MHLSQKIAERTVHKDRSLSTQRVYLENSLLSKGRVEEAEGADGCMYMELCTVIPCIGCIIGSVLRGQRLGTHYDMVHV